MTVTEKGKVTPILMAAELPLIKVNLSTALKLDFLRM